MKILIVDQFGKTTGRDTLALADLLNQNRDIEVTVFLADTTEIPMGREYSVEIEKGFSGAYEGNIIHKAICYLKALRQLLKFIKKHRFDVIHLQWFSLPWLEWIYLDRLKRLAKVVITVHDVIPFDNRPWEMESLDKIYARANALIMHTETGKQTFGQNYKTKTPITVVSQGFCMKSDYQKVAKNEAKEYFGIPRDAVVFLYYGTIRPSKGLDVLIRAVGEAYQSNQDIYLLAAGAFHNVNEEEYKELVRENLDDKNSTVKYGFVPQEEEKWYFSAADVLCLPYSELTQSGVAQLGLMYELPIIATDVGEMREVCRNGENGILIPVGEKEALTSAILKIASDEAFRVKAIDKSKSLGENDFSLVKKAEQIADLYRKL